MAYRARAASMMRQHLVDVVVEVVVDHDVSARPRPIGSSTSAFCSRASDLVVRVAAPAQARSCSSRDGGSTKISIASGYCCLHLLGAVDLDLEHDVARRRAASGVGRAVVVAEELGPLEEAAVVDALFERRRVGEDVGVVRLGRALLAGGPRPAQPQRGIALDERIDDGALADPSGAGDDDDQRSRLAAASAE